MHSINFSEIGDAKRNPIGGNRVIWSSEGHTFGTDAVLLADFSSPKTNEAALDLCTGCGIIPLLWAIVRENEGVSGVFSAHGLEIDPEGCVLFEQSAKENGYGEIITPICADLREIAKAVPCESFDLVSCNPPYFVEGSGAPNPSERRLAARSESMCTIDDVCRAAAFSLKYGGRFCLCHRAERIADVVCAMRKYKLEPKRLRLVQDTARKAPWLILAEGKKGAKPSAVTMPALIMRNEDGSRTDELRRIYGRYGEC
ncbi:MAG: hypothetical protein LBL82_07000 [Oscillospiraceae bacterium]|jgi:tRNA1(Val) A37 N6-methylase TrmN6|nr:hypothetical protein [Oscillospiraceae bacterium]